MHTEKATRSRVILLGLALILSACAPQESPTARMQPTLDLHREAANFTFQPLIMGQGKSQQLTQFKGRVIYLDFWASWCKPCRTSMPLLDKLRLELKDRGFEVIAVNLDIDAEQGRIFLTDHPVNYPVVTAADGTINALYPLQGLPTAYLIDKQGILHYVHQGFKAQDIDNIRQRVLGLLE